ncbi:Acyl dehydratase [Paramagnetospirillum caucaseum]|uniref:Acyl dehydratase n=1 Tax=Paramagnetospirillum caucaseum TaxID=1244869 RepID=M2Z8S4_9PROT|nr:MaoC family dehydratase [Paramagnetospirillum caucaseum]EME70730.1 Acyl dehydratase [Paramagnetospirillum caucaseum]
MTHYLEDLTPGRVFASPAYAVTADDIKGFAAAWDPQHFHLDEDSAKDSFFAGLAASGWHTAAATMRLMVTSELQLPLGIIGSGLEYLKWHRPVRPGDVLTLRIEVVETREMRSRPGMGLARLRVETLDSGGLPVQTLETQLVVPCRDGSPVHQP